MTDYKNLKLIASSSPHIRSNENTRSIMLDVIIAMLPALVWAIYNFGFKALISVVVSVVACLFWEWLYRKLLKKPQSIGDLSAVVTGMLLAFVCPPELPWWTLIIGAFFSIVVVKQLYGGIGKNFANPALVGRIVLFVSFASSMNNWLQLPEPRSGRPCHSAGQLCHRYDHLDPAHQQGRHRGLHRDPPGHHEGGHRGEVHRADRQLLRGRYVHRPCGRLPG